MIKRSQKIALIHVARKQLGLKDDEYRLLLESAAGITTCKAMKTEAQFRAIMEAFKKAGFTNKKRPKQNRKRPAWKDKWCCSDDMRAKIEALWREVARDPSDKALRAFCKRITHLEAPNWMNNKQAVLVVQALLSMKEQQAGSAINS